jgi:hypothetical protein
MNANFRTSIFHYLLQRLPELVVLLKQLKTAATSNVGKLVFEVFVLFFDS